MNPETFDRQLALEVVRLLLRGLSSLPKSLACHECADKEAYEKGSGTDRDL